MEDKKLTTASGRPYVEHENNQSAGWGSVLWLGMRLAHGLDIISHEKKMASHPHA